MKTQQEVEDIWLAVLRQRLPIIKKTAEGLQVTIDGNVFLIPQKSTQTGVKILSSR